LVHTLIWAFFVAAIIYVLWSGITDHVTANTWIAVCLIMLEGIIIMVFRGRCPLTLIARKYSNSTRNNFDIYLPEWLAKYNKQIFTTLFAIGLTLVLLKSFN
jgi:hypothetical protein